MRGRKIAVTLDANSLRNAAKEVQSYKRYLQGKIQELLDRLAEEGYVIARAGFMPGMYQYDGTLGETKVYPPEKRGEYTRAVVAIGRTTLFIEFGTGVTYPDDHPEKDVRPKGRGQYGYGLGKLKKGWRYKGEPGTNGERIKEGKHAGEIHTYGNPANMPMYEARKFVQEQFAEIVREVFND